MAFFTPPQSASAAVKIIAPSAVPDNSIQTSPKKDVSQQQCRNTLIHGSCKFQDKGCVYLHPSRPTTSPTASAPPPETPGVSAKLSLDANASVFVPKSSTLPSTSSPISRAQAETSLAAGVIICPDQRSVTAPQPETARDSTKLFMNLNACVFVPKSSSLPPTSSALSCAQVRTPLKADDICPDQLSAPAPQPETSGVSTKLSLDINAPIFVPKSLPTPPTSPTLSRAQVRGVICPDKSPALAPQPETSRVATMLSLDINAPVFVPKFLPSLPTSPTLSRGQMQTSLSAGVISLAAPQSETPKISAKLSLDVNAPVFSPKSSPVSPASPPSFGTQVHAPLMAGGICPNRSSAKAPHSETPCVFTKSSLDVNASVFVPESSPHLSTSPTLSRAQAQTYLSAGVTAPQSEMPRVSAKLSLYANAPVFVPRTLPLPSASPPLSCAQAQIPLKVILSNSDYDENESYDPTYYVPSENTKSAVSQIPLSVSYYQPEYDQGVECDRQLSSFIRQPLDYLLDPPPPPSPPPSYFTSSLYGPVQEVSKIDSRQRIDVMRIPSSLTLEHVPTLPLALARPDNSASDPIHKLITKDEQCITTVNTSPSHNQEHILPSLPTPANKQSDYVEESPTDNKQAINTPSFSTQEHVSTSQSSHSRILTPPDKLSLILPVSRSSWIKDKNKLDSLIDQLRELASSASAEHRSQLSKQVLALHTTSKKQNEHLIDLLQMSEECANRRLLYISAEIEQQSSFLDKLKGRLKAAEDLQGQAADLQMWYESKTVVIMRNLRAKVLSRPLQEDQALFSEVDLVLTEIMRCYVELDKFWVEEISRASEALKMRRVDPTDRERWKSFHKNIKQTIESWKNEPPSGYTQTLRRNNARSSTEIDVGEIASSLSLAMGLLRSALDRLPSSNSVKYSQSSQSSIQQVYQAFAANSDLCLEYWEKVLAWCLPSIVSPTPSRVYAPHGFRERTLRLRSEMTHVSVENTAGVQGSRKFEAAYDRALSLEQKTSSGLNSLLEQLSSCLMATDGHGLPDGALPDVITLEQLREQWEKTGCSVREALAILKNEPAPQSPYRSATSASASPASTRPRSVMRRWMTNFGRFS